MVITVDGELLAKTDCGSWNVHDALASICAEEVEEGVYSYEGSEFDVDEVELLSDEEWED